VSLFIFNSRFKFRVYVKRVKVRGAFLETHPFTSGGVPFFARRSASALEAGMSTRFEGSRSSHRRQPDVSVKTVALPYKIGLPGQG